MPTSASDSPCWCCSKEMFVLFSVSLKESCEFPTALGLVVQAGDTVSAPRSGAVGCPTALASTLGCPNVDGGVEYSTPPPGSGGIAVVRDRQCEDFPRTRGLALGFGSFGGIPLHFAAARAPRTDRSCAVSQLSLIHFPKRN